MVRRTLMMAAVLTVSWTGAAFGSEVQGWDAPQLHGHQIVNLTTISTLPAPVDVRVDILLHNNPTDRHVSFVRWSDGSNVKQVVKVSVQGDGSPEQKTSVILHLDPKLFDHDGWRELRVTTNWDKPRRHYSTTRMPVLVSGSGKSVENYAWDGKGAGRCGGGWWYDGYLISFVDCRDVQKAQDGPLVAGDVVRIKGQDGQVFANLDPHFHAGDEGTPLLVAGAANKWLTVTIPAGLAPGPHKLHIRTQRADGKAGAFVYEFVI